jgi:hypothetical protein
MKTYTGIELDVKINEFLTKRTQRFPELTHTKRVVRKDVRENGLFGRLEKASSLWTQYIHA